MEINNIFLWIDPNADNHAGSKAPRDLFYFFGKKVKNPKMIKLKKLSFVNTFQNYYYLIKILKRKNLKNENVVMQYPTAPILSYNGDSNFFKKKFQRVFLDKLFEIIKRCQKSILYIHDIYTFRTFMYINQSKKESIKKHEKSIFNKFDKIIVHSKEMKRKFIEEFEFESHKIIILCAFDYNFKDFKNQKSNLDSQNIKIAYAGNLRKNDILKKIISDINEYNIENVSFNFYGPGGEWLSKHKNFRWHGSYSPEILPNIINKENDFGLLWGDVYGIEKEYLEINYPHKMSSYISAYLPIISYDFGHTGYFVKKNEIGFTINSLKELKDINYKINNTEYNLYLKNINIERNKLYSGHYTIQAFQKALNN